MAEMSVLKDVKMAFLLFYPFLTLLFKTFYDQFFILICLSLGFSHILEYRKVKTKLLAQSNLNIFNQTLVFVIPCF